MCGIIGGVSINNIVPYLMNGLQRLEYRGYDSAGIAVVDPQGELRRRRELGKIQQLIQSLDQSPLVGQTGIAHTRWATHGKPSEKNAHPHIASDQIAIVHNGIIENHQTLRAQLIQQGCIFTSDTDSELIAHSIYLKAQQYPDFLTAVFESIAEFKGAFAIAVLNRNMPGRVIAVRHGSPLVLSLTTHGVFVASDTLALTSTGEKFVYLEDGDLADVYIDRFMLYDANRSPVERKEHIHQASDETFGKGKYKHFMLKEIFDQPQAIAHTLQRYISNNKIMPIAFGPNAETIFSQVKRVQIVACGTSFHAGLVAKYWFEELLNLPCQVEIASEYRYRTKVIEPNTLFVAISQSGETADTLAALRQAKEESYLALLTICNVASSSIVREADIAILTMAGIEIGVASTKAFTTQLVALVLLISALADCLKINSENIQTWLQELGNLPSILDQILTLHSQVKSLASLLVKKNHAFFLGRGTQLPIAMEGALKLKEISYVHAEAYSAGELKHGPLALIDHDMPVIILAPNNALIDKVKSNLEEVHTRGGQIILFTDQGTQFESKEGMEIFYMPKVHSFLSPIAYVIPLQLLAYYVAAMKGTDIDQPRNLAKSVTVE